MRHREEAPVGPTVRRCGTWKTGGRAIVLAMVVAMAVATLPVALAGASPGRTAASSAGRSAAGSGACPVDALGPNDKVELTFWHVLTAENEQVLQGQIAKFEAAHPNITVKLVNQTAYTDLFDKYTAGLSTGDLPDVAQFEETTVQQLVDSQSTVPIAACVKADKYPLKDFLPRAIGYYTINGQLQGMPWVVSNPVVVFNKTAVVKAGIDPTKAPATFDQLRQYAQKIVDSGAAKAGVSLPIFPYVVEYLYAKSGLQYVNNSNGRKARATASVLASAGGKKIWTWWKQMVDDGLALNTGATLGSTDHLFAIANGNAAITIDASSVLGPAYGVLSTGQFPGVELSVWPLPALTPGGGVPVGDGSLWIPKATSAKKKAAAWELIKFLDDPAQIASLTVSSEGGYIPIRRSSLKDPALQALWAERPFLKVPYDQLAAGPDNATTQGSVIGAYQGVRSAVRDGFVRMLTQGQSPKAAITQAQQEATTAIQDYNSRVGAG
jgi:sn-glycerol 3-phosphate transport system substrate-binding protein